MDLKDKFSTLEDMKWTAKGRIPEDSRRILPPVLPTMSGSIQQLCMCASVAPSHTSLVVQQFLARRNIPVITQPP
jgi:hypothetical protein